MMTRIRETALLLRIQLCRLGGINSLLHGHDPRQKRRALGTLALCLMLVLMASGYSLMLAMMLADLGAVGMIPQAFTLALTALAFMTAMFKGPEMLFGGSDTPALRAMPVAPGSIVASRLLALLATELVFSLLIGVPAGAVYGLHMGAAGGVRLVLALCLVPALPMAAALALGTLLARLTLRMRHRALLTAVLNVALFVAIMALCGALTAAGVQGRLTQSVMLAMMGRLDRLLTGLYPPADWTAQAAAGNGGALVLLAAVSLGALALLTLAATACFARLADALGMAAPAARGSTQTGRPRSPLRALYGKEVRRFTSSSIYMMNASAGLLIYAMATAAACLTDLQPVLAPLLAVPVVRSRLPGLLTLAAMLLAGMTSTTSSSISMEGRQMETLHAMPVRRRDWLGAKLLLQMTLSAPVLALCGGVLALRLGLSAAQGAMLILAPAAYSLVMGIVGLALNLRFPRFDWEREVEAVKNGLSVLLTILIGMLVPLGIGAAWLLL